MTTQRKSKSRAPSGAVQASRREQLEIELSEQRFQATFDLVPVGIWHIDSGGRILLANPRVGQILGYASDELIGRDIKEFWFPEDEQATRELWTLREKLYAGEMQRISTERRYRHKNGSAVLVVITIALQRDAEGKALYDITAMEDITARKRGERMRNLEHSVTRCLSEAHGTSGILEAVIRVVCESEDWDSGGYHRWNGEAGELQFGGAWGIPTPAVQEFIDKWRKIVFRPGEGLVGRVWQMGEPLWVPDITREARALGVSPRLDLGTRGLFLFPVSAEGKAIGVLAFSSGEIRQPDEQLLGAARVIGGQIGQFLMRARAEEAVRKSEERFRSLTQLSSNIYWEQDDQYRFTSFSGSGPKRLLEGLPLTIGTRRWEQRYINMTSEDWAAHIALLVARQPFHDLELCRAEEFGRKVWSSVSGEPVFDAAGAFRGYWGVGKDITARKRVEELRALEHAVNRSLADADNAKAAVQSAIRAICESEGWECGRYFRWEEKAGVLRFIDAWGIPDPTIERYIEQSRDLSYTPGLGLVGKVWQSGLPIWVADVSRDARVAQAALARDPGIRGAFAFPVVSESVTIGVLAFSSREIREPDERLVEAIRMIGRQIGQLVRRKQAEEELRRFRAAMDASADLILLVDPVTLRYIDVNDAAVRALGYTRDEFLAMGPHDVFSVSREALSELYQRLIKGDQTYEKVEGWYRGKHGSRFLVESFPRALPSADGHIIVAVARDITEQRKREEELRRFRLALDNSADMIVLIDRATMRFVDVNRTACKLLGYSREELFEMGPQDVLPVGREELERSYDGLIATPSANTGVLMSGMKSHYRCKDGSLLPFESTRRVLRSGDSYIIAAISRDIRERVAAEAALKESNERFDIAVRATSDIIWDLDLITESLWWNENFTKVFGYPRESVNRTVKSWYDATHPDDRDRVEAGMRRLIESGGESWGDEYRFRRADGSYAEVLDRGHVIRDSAGKAVRMIGAMEDVTSRKQAEEKMRSQALRQRLIAEFGQQVLASTDLADVLNRAVELVSKTLKSDYCSLFELDHDGKNLVFKAAVGWPAEWIGRRTVPVRPGTRAELVLSRHEPLIVEDYNQEAGYSTSDFLMEFGVRSGIVVPLFGTTGTFGMLSAHALQPRRFTEDEVNFLRNVANILAVAIERKKAEEQLAYLAQFDSLTSLPNRHLFHDRLAQTMAQAKRNGRPMAVLFIDLDRFKLVNDTLGHGAGDELLKEAAGRLAQCVRSGDTVGRFGGDEFGAVLADLGKPGDASIVAQKIIDAMGRPFNLDGHETYVSASIGITLFPADSDEPAALVVNADVAMYRAKEQGRGNYQYFTREMNERATERVQLEAALRRAIERKEFLLYYQPKVDLKSGAICGLEALLRWRHPDKGMVSPVEFIPVLEDTGLIVRVGEWVIWEACAQIKMWQKAGLPDLPVAINLSARQFQQKELEPTVRSIWSQAGVDPSLIQFELTESMLMKDPEAAARTLRGLKESGVKLSVDDFGTGYSSLAYLKRFPIDSLKIDRAFIRDITTDPENAAITLAIIGLARSLKLKVVAEGVETEDQLEFLIAHACDEMQGYYFAKPVAPAEMEAMLREDRRLKRGRAALGAMQT